jgi:hypothetical protein
VCDLERYYAVVLVFELARVSKASHDDRAGIVFKNEE